METSNLQAGDLSPSDFLLDVEVFYCETATFVFFGELRKNAKGGSCCNL